jgi:hypothetical protein
MDMNSEIQQMIYSNFPDLAVCIFPDETQDSNIIVAIDDEIYYSDAYQSLVLKIKTDLLWPNEMFNYLFVKEKHAATIPFVKESAHKPIDRAYAVL